MAKIFTYNVVIVRLGKEDQRVCDYCNKILVAPGGVVLKTAFLTKYGMMCSNCIGQIQVICIYKVGEDVSNTAWYKG